MNPDDYLKVADRLLQRHYAIGVADTGLCEPKVIEGFLADSVQPFEAVNNWAEKVDLHRVDKHGRLGRAVAEPLTKRDQDLVEKTFSNPTPLKFKPTPALSTPSGPGV